MKNHGNHFRGHFLTRTLGGFALGLGAAQLAAPRHLAKLMGLRPSAWCLGTLRLLGLRESLSGLGILRGRRPAGWLGWRLAGDAMDAGLLMRAMASRRSFTPWRKGGRGRLAASLAAVGGVAALDAVAFALQAARRRGPAAEKRPTVTASITIDRSAADLYAFWRDVENLPRFVPYLDQVKANDRIRSHWRAKAPHGPAMEWDALIVDDRPEQRIAWKIEGKSRHLLPDSGEITFKAAPAGQGTEVHVTMWSSGMPGSHIVNRWLSKLPRQFLATQLRRFKQLMELGEVTVSDASLSFGPHPAQPSTLPGEREAVSPGMRKSTDNGESARAS